MTLVSKKTLPIFVHYLAKRLRFEYPEIVHQNIGFADALYESVDTRGSSKIGGNALDFDLRHVLCEPLHRGVNAPLGAAIEHHRSACFGEAARNREADQETRGDFAEVEQETTVAYL